MSCRDELAGVIVGLGYPRVLDGRIMEIGWMMAIICHSLSLSESWVQEAGLEFRQNIYLSDGQVDLQNHLSVMKSTCPTQENHKFKRLFMLRHNNLLCCGLAYQVKCTYNIYTFLLYNNVLGNVLIFLFLLIVYFIA